MLSAWIDMYIWSKLFTKLDREFIQSNRPWEDIEKKIRMYDQHNSKTPFGEEINILIK